MQINAFKTGWLRKRVRVACTLMAADVESLRRELDAFKQELHEELEHHGAKCARLELIVAAGTASSRANRPAMTDLLTNDPDLRKMAGRCPVKVAFLNRMGDMEGKFRIKA
jgi:hypothetical protein